MESPREEPTIYSRYHKICPPGQYFSIFKKMSSGRAKLLKQLEQLDYDTKELREADMRVLQKRCQQLLRQSYSFKYIGIKDNQIGILSKRVRPNCFTPDLLPKVEDNKVVTAFFYPKPLRTVSNACQKLLTADNLENEIKRFFPRHEKKMISHSIKVRGSWANLKCAGRSPTHLKNKESSLSSNGQQNFKSYSRTLSRGVLLHHKSELHESG